MKFLLQILLIVAGYNSVKAQPTNNFSDMLLTSTMKVFQSADFEMAYHMLPFVHERFEKELKDTNSFHQPYDSLSKYIGIKYSSDNLLKTYCWSERSGGCCHTSARFVQYRTQSGNIQYVDLDEDREDGGDLFITKLHKIEIDSQTMYLFLNWGTCCGGKHYETANVYSVVNETLVKVDSVFGDVSTLHIRANRTQKIDLTYSPETQTLSFIMYQFDPNTNFYTDEKSVVTWKLTSVGFELKDEKP